MAGVAALEIKVPKPDNSHDYKKMSTVDLQNKYDKTEAWLKANREDSRWERGSIELKRMNKELASRS